MANKADGRSADIIEASNMPIPEMTSNLVDRYSKLLKLRDAGKLCIQPPLLPQTYQSLLGNFFGEEYSVVYYDQSARERLVGQQVPLSTIIPCIAMNIT